MLLCMVGCERCTVLQGVPITTVRKRRVVLEGFASSTARLFVLFVIYWVFWEPFEQNVSRLIASLAFLTTSASILAAPRSRGQLSMVVHIHQVYVVL